MPDGRFMLHAFGDRDGDGLPQRDDPATSMPVTIDVAGDAMVSLLDLELVPGSADAVRRMLPAQMPVSPLHSTQAGALADLDAPGFSADTGREGYWAPMDAFRRDGGNIYFLEPYDPARIPVLFVHGAAGSAQDWRHFFDQLDRRRYQAWFFQYPSGAAMDSMAYLLYWKLFNLQRRYHFERLHLVAYSMGGLLVRRFLLDHGEQFPQIGRFISLSTPWGGEAAATLGVQHSPAVVPSWRDMQPEGPFLKHLFERPLPAGVDHLLLFGHRGGYNLLRPNSDGTVTLASQLRPEAQAEARLVMGFDEDHASIVTASQVIGQVARLLDAADAPDAVAGGRLQVLLSFADARAATVRGVPALELIPISEADGTASKPLMLPLSADDSDRRMGPITPGTYDARLLAHAHSSMPARQRVTLEPGGVSSLVFQLSPQGVLGGYVGADGDSLTHPAGSYRPPHPTLPIRRIELAGPGGQRTLIPRDHGDPDVSNAYFDGRDDAVGALFSFVNLPEGEYVLTIVAEGHEPHVSQHRIVPGQVTPTAPILRRALR